jgi:hypothetical protein
MINVEQSVEWELEGETEVLGENLPQCHFVHHESRMTWPGLNPGRRGGKPAINRLSYGTANAAAYIRKVTRRISTAAPAVLGSLFADDATTQRYIRTSLDFWENRQINTKLTHTTYSAAR